MKLCCLSLCAYNVVFRIDKSEVSLHDAKFIIKAASKDMHKRANQIFWFANLYKTYLMLFIEKLTVVWYQGWNDSLPG